MHLYELIVWPKENTQQNITIVLWVLSLCQCQEWKQWKPDLKEEEYAPLKNIRSGNFKNWQVARG